ncbi:MAG: DUF2231 domain-containing protein [Sphingomonadaceae bacterium]
MVNPRSTARIGGHPLHPMLVPLPIGFLVAAFVFDLAYWLCEWAMGAYLAAWMIAAGIASALLAALAGLTDFLGEPRIRALRQAWYHMLANLTAVALSVANLVVHMRDGAAAVLPAGIVLSGLVAALLLFSGWMGGEMVYRHHVAVIDADEPG